MHCILIFIITFSTCNTVSCPLVFIMKQSRRIEIHKLMLRYHCLFFTLMQDCHLVVKKSHCVRGRQSEGYLNVSILLNFVCVCASI